MPHPKVQSARNVAGRMALTEAAAARHKRRAPPRALAVARPRGGGFGA